MNPDDADGITVEGNTTEAQAEIAAMIEGEAAPAAPATPAPQDARAQAPEADAEGEAPDAPHGAETPPIDRNADGTFKKGGKNKSIQARIDREVWARREAERRAEALEQRLAESTHPAPAQSTPPSPTAPSDGKPTLRQFTDRIGVDVEDYEAAVEAYTEARDEWRDRQTQTREQERREHERGRAWQDRLSAFATSQPDFHEVIEAQASLPIPAVMREAILQSEVGPAIVYFLGTHPDDAFQLAQAYHDVHVSAAPLMRSLLESKVSVQAAPSGPAQTPPRKPLPAPIKPVASGPHVTESPPGDDADDETHRQYYNAKELARTRR